jgi:hypothetical protein
VTEIVDTAELVGRDVAGRAASWTVKADQLVDLPGSALLTQRVRTADGTTLVRRSLREGSDDPAFSLLDNEIRALARLARAFGDAEERPFPLLLGYDVDGRDPWALVTDYRGRPAREAVSGLLTSGQLELVTGLFGALARMALVEVAHNRLDLSGMYLAGTALSIVNFEHAAFFGEPRPGRSGVASRPQEDMVDAGRLLYEVFTGEPAYTDRPDLSEVPLLRTRLSDLFGEPRERPSAADVLKRFVAPASVPVLAAPDPLAAGWAAFDEARAKKQPERPAPPDSAPPRRSRRWGLGMRGGFAVFLLLALGGRS